MSPDSSFYEYIHRHYVIRHWYGSSRHWLCPECNTIICSGEDWCFYYGTDIPCPECGQRYMLTGNFGEKSPVYVPIAQYWINPMNTYWQLITRPALPAPQSRGIL